MAISTSGISGGLSLSWLLDASPSRTPVPVHRARRDCPVITGGKSQGTLGYTAWLFTSPHMIERAVVHLAKIMSALPENPQCYFRLPSRISQTPLAGAGEGTGLAEAISQAWSDYDSVCLRPGHPSPRRKLGARYTQVAGERA